jgi:hypothetical protein
VRFGFFDVALLVDGEGSFATMAEVFPALTLTEPWWLPVNVVLVRTGDTTVLVDTGLVYVSDHDPVRAAETRKQFLGQLADEGAAVIVSRFEGVEQVVRTGEGFR